MNKNYLLFIHNMLLSFQQRSDFKIQILFHFFEQKIIKRKWYGKTPHSSNATIYFDDIRPKEEETWKSDLEKFFP